MKLVVSRAVLAPALTFCAGIVAGKIQIPIIGNVALSAEGRRLSIRATDLSMEVSVSVPAEIEIPGETTIPAKLFRSIVSGLPEGDISLEAGAEKTGRTAVTIKAGRSKAALPSLPITDFPVFAALAERGEIVRWRMPGSVFAEALATVGYAGSVNNAHFYLQGVFLHVVAGRLIAVATNGHQLARWSTAAPAGTAGIEDAKGIIIPNEATAELIRLASDAEGDIEIATDHARLRVSTQDAAIVTKLIDATYPDYARVIPRDQPIRFDVDRGDLAAAVGRIKTLADPKKRGVRLTLTGGELQLAYFAPETADAEEAVSASPDAPDADGLVGLSVDYLVAALAAMPSETVGFAMDNPSAPVVLTPVALPEAAPDRLVVIVPLKI